MFKILSRIISTILFVSSVFLVSSVVSAQQVVIGLNETEDQGISYSDQNISKFSFEIRSARLSRQFRNFIDDVYTGQPDVVTGLFVNEEFAMDVLQQPANNPGYISSYENTVTEFSMARDYGTIGMLAHNYLAGDQFNSLEIGDVIYLVFGDGSFEPYTIAESLSYQALQPNSPYSNFVNLDNPEEFLSAADLFYSIYGQEDTLVLQTCIENEGIDSWGRLFIVAIPGVLPANSSSM